MAEGSVACGGAKGAGVTGVCEPAESVLGRLQPDLGPTAARQNTDFLWEQEAEGGMVKSVVWKDQTFHMLKAQ